MERESKNIYTVIFSVGVSTIKGIKNQGCQIKIAVLYILVPHVIVTAKQNPQKIKTYCGLNYLKVVKDGVKVAERMLLKIGR